MDTLKQLPIVLKSQKENNSRRIYMRNENLPSALCASITDEVGNAVTGILEVGLDSIFEDDLLKEVPLLSTVTSIYKIGHSIKERNYIKKLAEFIQALNDGVVDETQAQVFRDRILHDPKKAEKELEYILILVDRYISNGKSTIIAKLYLSYLDHKLNWEEFSMYAEMTDQLFIHDLNFLRKEGNQVIPEVSSDAALRLTSMGLLFEVHEVPEFSINHESGHLYCKTEAEKNEKIFSRTMFGAKYIKIIDSTNL